MGSPVRFKKPVRTPIFNWVKLAHQDDLQRHQFCFRGIGVQAINARCDQDQGVIPERSRGTADLRQKAGGESDLGLAQGLERIFEKDPPVRGGGGNPLEEDRFEWDESLH